MSDTTTLEQQFLFGVRDELARATGETFLPILDRAALRRPREHSDDLLFLIMQPHDHEAREFLFSLIVGRSFDVVRDVRARTGIEGTLAQIQQFADRLCGLPGIPDDAPTAWIESLSAQPDALAAEILEGIAPVAEPFFARFSSPRAARDALVAGEPWCRGGGPMSTWANVLALDLALGDLERFRAWSGQLTEPVRQQAEGLIALYAANGPGARASSGIGHP